MFSLHSKDTGQEQTVVHLNLLVGCFGFMMYASGSQRNVIIGWKWLNIFWKGTQMDLQ